MRLYKCPHCDKMVFNLEVKKGYFIIASPYKETIISPTGGIIMGYKFHGANCPKTLIQHIEDKNKFIEISLFDK